MIGFSHTPLDWAALLCAPIVGSFAGVVVDRTARGENFTTGRSHCEACGRDLQPYDLVPVFSWLALRGRCRYCHAGIRPSHLLIELAAVSIAVSAFLFSTGPALWAGCLLGWTLLVMGLIDLKTLKLPDFGNYLLIAGGMAVTYALAADAVIDHAIGAVSGFLTLFAVSSAVPANPRTGRTGARGRQAARGRRGLARLAGAARNTGDRGIAGLIVAIVAQNGQSFDRYRVVAFGPYLALAIWITWLAIAIAVP